MKTLAFCLLLALGIFLLRVSDYRSLAPPSNIERARQLYQKVNMTLPSVVSAKKHEEIILERLECYAENSDYAKRIGLCNNQYAKDIVKQARESLTSRPEMGLFVKNIQLCPVVHNMCTGQTNNDRERCIVFERQCIDYMLDSYWRGASLYSTQQYRSE